MPFALVASSASAVSIERSSKVSGDNHPSLTVADQPIPCKSTSESRSRTKASTDMQNPEELRSLPAWKARMLTAREHGVSMRMKNPPHPGDFIRTEIIKLAGLSVTAAAAALQVSRPALSSLLNGKAEQG
jgi:hypothetical protein